MAKMAQLFIKRKPIIFLLATNPGRQTDYGTCQYAPISNLLTGKSLFFIFQQVNKNDFIQFHALGMIDFCVIKIK
jgi:hypothetical protein